MTNRTLGTYGCVALFFGATMFACAPATDDVSGLEQQPSDVVDDAQSCVPGEQSACACPGGSDGVQVCSEDGAGLGACDCGPAMEDEPNDACGDGTCAMGEDCHSCTADCGTCEPCDIAPSCSNAHVPPASLPHAPDFDVPKMERLSTEQLQLRLEHAIVKAGPEIRVLAAALDQLPELDEHPLVTSLREVFAAHPVAADALRRQLSDAGMGSPGQYRLNNPARKIARGMELSTRDVNYPGGTVECGAPLLRVAVNKITVHEEDDDFANDIVYCVVQAESAQGAEIRITPKTPNLDEGESHTFALESGVIWGQQGPTTPGGNMLITYDCIEADSTDGYQALVNAIGQAAGQLGNVVEGDNGWIFSTTAAIAPVVSTGLALDNDDHLFNAQQTIGLDKQLELTNGAYWTVRREGTHFLSDWDWELFINVWGCAEYGTL